MFFHEKGYVKDGGGFVASLIYCYFLFICLFSFWTGFVLYVCSFFYMF